MRLADRRARPAVQHRSCPSPVPLSRGISRCCLVASAHAAHACAGPRTRAAAAQQRAPTSSSSPAAVHQKTARRPPSARRLCPSHVLMPHRPRPSGAAASHLHSELRCTAHRSQCELRHVHCTSLAVRAAPCALHTARPTNPLRAARQICTPTPQPPQNPPKPHMRSRQCGVASRATAPQSFYTTGHHVPYVRGRGLHRQTRSCRPS